MRVSPIVIRSGDCDRRMRMTASIHGRLYAALDATWSRERGSFCKRSSAARGAFGCTEIRAAMPVIDLDANTSRRCAYHSNVSAGSVRTPRIDSAAPAGSSRMKPGSHRTARSNAGFARTSAGCLCATAASTAAGVAGFPASARLVRMS